MRWQFPDSDLSIVVEGMYENLTLTDPRGRTSFIAPDGRTTKFPGCERLDFPDFRVLPDSVDYTKFYVRRPIVGPYRLTLETRGTYGLAIETTLLWTDSTGGRRGISDHAGLQAFPGEEITIVLSVAGDGPRRPDSLSVMISELRKRRPR